MGFILRFLSGPLGLYAMIAVGVLLAGSITYGYVQHANAERYQVERDAARNENTRLVTAVQSKDGIIDDLTAALQLWQTRAAQSAKASTEAGERAQNFQTQLGAARSRIRALSEADRALPDCQKLMSMDIAACPGALDGVRQWTRRSLERQGDREAGSGGAASGPTLDR